MTGSSTSWRRGYHRSGGYMRERSCNVGCSSPSPLSLPLPLPRMRVLCEYRLRQRGQHRKNSKQLVSPSTREGIVRQEAQSRRNQHVRRAFDRWASVEVHHIRTRRVCIPPITATVTGSGSGRTGSTNSASPHVLIVSRHAKVSAYGPAPSRPTAGRCSLLRGRDRGHGVCGVEFERAVERPLTRPGRPTVGTGADTDTVHRR